MSANVTLTLSLVELNTAQYGAGLSLDTGLQTIQGCEIRDNGVGVFTVAATHLPPSYAGPSLLGDVDGDGDLRGLRRPAARPALDDHDDGGGGS